MRTYRRAWRGFWSAVGAVGFTLALLESSALGVLFVLALLLGLCRLARHLLPDLTWPWPSLTVAFGILTLWSFSWVSPPLGLLVLVTAALSSPALLGRALGPARRSGAGRVTRGPADASTGEPRSDVVDGDFLTLPEAMGPLKGLDDRQLCRVWRESFWVLRRQAAPATTLCLVALREACLDELERRDAAAFHAWLESGARASGGPEKYLAHPPRRLSGAD